MSGLAEEDIEQSALGRWLRIGGGALLLAAAVAALVFIVQGLGGEARGPARQVTKITVLDTPPPPPPPPPKEEPRREQPKESPKEIKIDQPKQVEQPQQAEQLKMEGQAGDGPSPFAAGTVLNEYKGGEIGAGTGGNRMQFAFYTSVLQRHVQTSLVRRPEIKRLDYRVLVRIWLGGDGSIRKAELVDSTGSSGVDDALRAAFGALAPVPEAPPANLPQPITVRITNRVTG
ncbi:energy transducer TonB family protein [Thauera sinica]|uniref:Energy transducer TonB n=1 Tax=Thauera sinica TaxID=2665146 RepID=A0ABW1ANA6_9RHOO|nr:TonB family protein [Thauera sp. K11]ATE60502.1 TonB-dependent receptor [Thauera sp. K11]